MLFIPGGWLGGGINEDWATGPRDGCNTLLVVILKTPKQ
jgi:hypothetical protein